MELRDLPSDGSLSSTPPLAPGVIGLGPYTLTVSKDSATELRIPVGAHLTIRTAA